ncbi:MAG TPA: PEP-CTERM sorting domain-containing protein [Verrucomicrobiae bacterium]|nr:PEP-CTERM sorting domain-containing protein [Verrucomicrobiae bacterium]
MKTPFCIVSAVAFAITAHGQPLQWEAYDTGGNLLAGMGGSGGNTGFPALSLSIPANSTRVFVARNFQPLDVSANGSISTINLSFSISTGLQGAPGYNFGMGVYNSAGTDAFTDDTGLFSLWDAQSQFPELFVKTDGPDLFAGPQQGQSGVYSGGLLDATTYDALVRIVNTDGSVSLGNGTPLANAGIAYQGLNVDQRVFMSPVSEMPFLYDLFAFIFVNTTEEEATLNVNEMTLLVPEPSVFALAGLGFLGMLARRRRRD